MRARYSKWDGSQDPFKDDLDVGELLDEISDDLLTGLPPNWALRRLMQRGMGDAGGLEDLMRRLRERRMQAAKELNLPGPLNEIKDRLDEIVGMERGTLAETEGEDARMREANLDMIPNQPAAALRELMDYKFLNPQAQERFNELVEQVREQILSSVFGELSEGMKNMSAQDVARMREMLAELNQMIAARDQGEPYDFDGFMSRYGDMFPENPRNLEELLEVLARRMAAMSRLLASLSPQQRRQLQELASAVMQDLDIAFQMDQLRGELQSLMPNLPWGEQVPGFGDQPAELAPTLDAIDQLSEMEELERALAGETAGASISDVDEQALRRALGDEAVRDLRKLKQIEKALEEAGLLQRRKGQLELTARGARKIGERALVRIFERLKLDRSGSHEASESGGAAEPTGSTRPWHFGDVGQIAVQKTVFNAIVREARLTGFSSDRGFGRALQPEDFELVEAETRTRTATALLLDQSFSMPLRGHWVHAKRMALALHALIEGKYPQDQLYLIGFSNWARKLEPPDLASEGLLERVYGTNMQHAFLMARRLLAGHPRAAKQVIMVTDGEPTAHLTDDLSDYLFAWPPMPQTITKTLAEAVRLSTEGVTLNIFMLEESEGLTRFMEQLAQRTGGRVFHSSSEELGHFVVSDYVRSR